MIAAPPLRRSNGRRWARENLFSSRANTLLTLLTLALVLAGGYVLFGFLFLDVDRWDVIGGNRRSIFLGRYPSGEEWRLWPPLWAAFALAGYSFGLWSRLSRRDLVWLGGAVAFLLAFIAQGQDGVLFGGAVALAALLYMAGRASRAAPAWESRGRRLTLAGWLVLVPFTLLLIVAFDGVKPSLWGGFLLNILLAVVGIGFGLPLGILFALGRASSLPALRLVSTAVIELTRGGPLLAWLFISRFVLPDFLPDALNTDPIVNAMIVVCLFEAAYVAEIVRGGLQALPRGQIEAAQAVGLGSVSITLFIVLPQALRAVLPALVSQLIALWKDTTLFTILGFVDALKASQNAANQPAFKGTIKETLAFIGLGFWTIAFAMSRLTARLERTLGVGVR